MPQAPVTFLEDTFAGAKVRLAVFGKHPAAADHLEDLGLSTASLVVFKQGFYIDGIGGSLARQAWHKELPATDTIPYDHELLCVGVAGWLAVRFIHSADASGRRQYPLVIAVHGLDMTVLSHATAIFEELDALASSLARLTDGAAMRQAHAAAQTEWEALMSRWSADPVATCAAKETWLRAESLKPDWLGLHRITHALVPHGAGAGRARVPFSGVDLGLSCVLWLSFVRMLLQEQAPVLTILIRHGEAYGDLVLGPPGARSLSALFAGLPAHPLTSSVPFNLAAGLVPAVNEAAAEWARDVELFPAMEPGEDSSNTLLQRICSGFRSWLKS